MVDCMTVVVLACQVGLFHHTLTQINSEMNFIAKKKCPDSQKLDTIHLNARHVLRLRTCTCLHSLSTLCKSIRKSYFHSETVLFCQMFLLLLERDGSVIRSHET